MLDILNIKIQEQQSIVVIHDNASRYNEYCFTIRYGIILNERVIRSRQFHKPLLEYKKLLPRSTRQQFVTGIMSRKYG